MQETAEPKAEPVTFKTLDGTVTVPFRVGVRPGEFLEGHVRPPTRKELRDFYKATAKPGADVERTEAEFYAAHVKGWNLDAPPTAEAVLNLPAPLFAALDRVVCDLEGCELVLGKSGGSSPS